MPEIASLLGQDGPIAACLPGFIPRQQQQTMARTIATALNERQVLVTEAGTGTGKTLAYLVPTLLSGKKIIISTATKTLQEQLFQRDIPLVRSALSLSLPYAMLKGRSNYLCPYRLLLAEQTGVAQSPRYAKDFHRIKSWAQRTHSGDIGEIDNVAENSSVWYQVTSTTDNCLGQECPEISNCHVLKARRRAQEAELLIINHHLLFSDMMLKEEGFGELLPSADGFILDEAHQLPEIAGRFFGTAISGHQFSELARDVVKEFHLVARDTPALADAAAELEKLTRDFRLALGGAGQRAAWQTVCPSASVQEQLASLQERLQQLQTVLKDSAVRGKGLENCWQRSMNLEAGLRRFSTVEDGEEIRWYETSKRSFVLHATPMDIATTFRDCMARYRSAWVFTSATLAVGEHFEHFTNRLGIVDAVTARWESPFDYRRNALLYLPEALPQPATEDYTRAVVEAVVPVLKASRGRAFLLFTSHRALQQAAVLLARLLEYPLLVQGQAPRSELLQQFRSLQHAVLLGAGSFWEGVDVRGPKLSCVIIDKLPFASPDDPVFQARAAALRQQGGNPFSSFQLPAAVISLKQGVGRLIRDVHDRGVLVLCDPRLLSRSYGKVFLNNLPEMNNTHSMDDVARFFADEDEVAPPKTSIRQERVHETDCP